MIQLLGVRKVAGQEALVDVESFSVEDGQSAALIGPPGSGIETLLDLVVGRTQPTFGDVRIGGIDPFKDRAAFSGLAGVLFAEDGLYKSFSAEENLAFYCRLRGLPTSRARQVLALVGLGDQAKSRASQLSPGAQRRLAFGRSFLHSPSALVLVEPLLHCDETSMEIIETLLRQLAAGGAAVLVFAAESARFSGVCGRLYAVQQGSLVEIEKQASGEPAGRPFKIPVKQEGKVMLLNPLDIWYAEAEGDSACIHTLEGRLPTHYTLSELEARLGRSGFFRTHRAYLVNLQHVKEVIPFTRSSFSLRLDDPAGTLIPLSKAAAAELRALLDY
jgi:ABC-2 type transport system ATP-binding protein